MSVVAEWDAPRRLEPRSLELSVRCADSARLRASLGATWDALSAKGGSAYQSRAFLEPWIAHVAPALGIEPCLGIVENGAGAPVALLPFGATRRGALRTIVYLGGRDANLNGPLLDPDALPWTPAQARAVLFDFARASQRADLFVLANQPHHWAGQRNPFAFANAAPSPSAAYGATLGGDIDAFLNARQSRDARKKLRSKATRLATLGPVAFENVPPAQAPDIVAAFIAQKERRLASRGIDAGLDGPHVRSFLTALAAPVAGAPALDLYVLRVGEAVAAVFGGLAHGRHWHGLVNSYTDEPEIARCSPGDLLLRHVLGDLVRRGITRFDLGIGEARYKAALCDERIDLVDAIVPVTALGHAFAAVERTRLAAKRRIKQTPWAFEAARRFQAMLGRGTTGSPPADTA